MELYLNKSHLDVQYSPSKWSTRMCACKIIDDHISFTERKSEEARKTIPSHLDVVYGDSSAEKLDIIGTDLPDDAPICLFVHGGYWCTSSKEDSAYPALLLHKIGIKTFVINYALCPSVTLRMITAQIRRAFDFTLDYATKMQSRSISLMGHSAGAHLISYLFTTYNNPKSPILSRVQDVILISGVYNLQPIQSSYVNDAVKLTQEDAAILSVTNKPLKPLHNFPKLQLNVIIAENESPAFHNQSQQFFDLLSDIGCKIEFIQIYGRDHFDIMASIVDDSLSDTCQNLSKVDNLSDVLMNIFKRN